MESTKENTGISEEVAVRLLSLQKRCVVCGETKMLQIHHRVFRSEGEHGLREHLLDRADDYLESYDKFFALWELHDIQNLCVLCNECHIGRVHGGDEELRQRLRNEFTEPTFGFCVPFRKKKMLW